MPKSARIPLSERPPEMEMALHVHPARVGWAILKITFQHDAHDERIGRALDLLFGKAPPDDDAPQKNT